MNDPRSADTARHTITPHLVMRDAAAASQWYQRALGPRSAAAFPYPAAGSCRSSSASATPP
jgi:hypothetical protein